MLQMDKNQRFEIFKKSETWRMFIHLVHIGYDQNRCAEA